MQNTQCWLAAALQNVAPCPSRNLIYPDCTNLLYITMFFLNTRVFHLKMCTYPQTNANWFVTLVKKMKHEQCVSEFVYFLTTKYPSHHSHLGTESHKSPSQPFSSFTSQISKGTKGSASLHIFFKIFPEFDFSDSSFGFRRNSGISKQISVPRWSSNLKTKYCQMFPQE